jgi:hypothetical protein
MERTTDKHSPRLDEAMSGEVQSLVDGAPVEARSDEGRRQEDMPQLDRGELDVRSELAASVASATFPATRDTLLAAARDDHAPEDVLALLEDLPPDGDRYENVEAVWEAALQ